MSLYPLRTKFRGYVGITLSVCLSVRLSVRLSVQICVQPITFFIPPWTKFRGVYRDHLVCPSVRLSIRLSVQIRVRPIIFLWFDIGLPWYLAHRCITMRRCVAFIVIQIRPSGQFYRVFDMFSCPAHNFFSGLTLAYHIWHMYVSPSENVLRTFMIPIQCWPLPSRSNLKAIAMSSCTTSNFC